MLIKLSVLKADEVWRLLKSGIDSNIKLSKERAEAVLQAIVHEQGIAPARLRSFGCGQFAPIADNDAEESRARTAGSNWSNNKQDIG